MLNNIEHIHGWSYINKQKKTKTSPIQRNWNVSQKMHKVYAEIETDSERWKRTNIALYLTRIFLDFCTVFQHFNRCQSEGPYW